MCHSAAHGPWTTPPGLVERDVTIVGPDGTWPGFFVEPEGAPTDAPAVVVISDIFGRTPFYERLCRRLAAAGHAAVLPEYFHAAGPLPARGVEAARERRRKLDEPGALGEVAGTVWWLRTAAPERPVAAIGFCLGGTFALYLAADLERLPTVCFYGFPGPSPRAGDRALTPPLERGVPLRSPLLGLWGTQDVGVGMENVARFEREARQEGGELEVHTYDGVGHGFLAHLDRDEGSPETLAARDAWQRTLDFLGAHLAASRR